jgi:hypothetical protein
MRPATDGEPTKVRQLVGNIDLDHRGVIGGWVFDRDYPDLPLDLEIYVDGRRVATIPTGRRRPDVEIISSQAGTSGFEFAIPPYLCDGKLHLITIVDSETSVALPGCPFAYELGHPSAETYRCFSLNDEHPSLLDIQDLTGNHPESHAALSLFADKRRATQPIDRVGACQVGFQPFTPYIVSFPCRFANPKHATVFSATGDVWQGCCYLRNTAQLIADQTRISAGATGIPRWGNIVIFAGSMRNNYFHWHLDCLASLYFVMRHVDLTNRFVLGPPLNSWQRESLELLGVQRYFPVDGLVYAESIITSGYTDGRGIFPDEHVRDLFQHLRAKLHAITTSPQGPRNKRVFVSRSDARHRILENEQLLCTALSERGFRRLVASELSYAEQMEIFTNAEAVVATHGAALTNAGFSTPGLQIFEIRHASYNNPCFEHLSLLLGHRHHLHLIDEHRPYSVDIGSFIAELDRHVGQQ